MAGIDILANLKSIYEKNRKALMEIDLMKQKESSEINSIPAVVSQASIRKRSVQLVQNLTIENRLKWLQDIELRITEAQNLIENLIKELEKW